MSFDRFASGLQLPNVGSGVNPRASDSSDFLRLYFKTDQLYHTDEAGTEVQLTGNNLLLAGGTLSGDVTFVDSANLYLGTGNDFSMRYIGGTIFNAIAGDVYFQDNGTTVMRQAGSNMRMYDSRNLQFGTGGDWAFQYNGTDAYMDLDSGAWRWRDGANGNADRIRWTPSDGLEFQDGHQLQLGTSNDLRMYHSSDTNYFDLVNGDLKVRDVSGTAEDRFVFTQAGRLGIGTDSPDVDLHVASGNPVIRLEDTNAASDAKQWNISAGGTNLLRFQALTDSGTGGGHLFEFERVGSNIHQFAGMKGGVRWFTIHNDDQKVGIGSSSPETLLHVQGPGLGGTAGDAEDLVIIRDQSNTTSGNADRIVFSHERLSTGTNWETAGMRIGRRVDSSEMGYIQFGHSSDTDGDLITFGDDAAELMRLTPQGKLGVGTTTPDVDLHVAGGLRVETSSDFDSGIDANKTASIMLPDTGEIAFDTGDYIRTLISKDSSGYINVGQNGTGIISRVNLLPGTSGVVIVQSDNNNALVINNNGSGNARMQYQIAGSNKYNVGVNAGDSSYTIYDVVNATTPFKIEPGSGNNAAVVIKGDGDVGIGTDSPGSPLTVAGVIESTSGGVKFPDGTTQTTAGSGGTVAFDDLTDKTSGTGTYATTGHFTAGLGSGGVSITNNDGGGNANVTFNHRSMTPEQTGNAGRIHVNTDLTTGVSMQFQVGSGLTSGVSAGITTYFKIEENLLTSNAAFNMPDTKVLQFGTGADWKWQFDSTDAYMTLDSGTWRWRDGAASNAVRIQWTPSAGLEFQDGHQLQLGTSNDLRMYHASNINYFDLVNGDLKIRDVSGTATDRFVFTQAGRLGIGTSSPNSTLSINGSINEKVYNLTGTAIDPDNGTIQYKTLTGNTTFTENLVDGEYVTLMIDDGSAYTVTWPTMYWPGGVAPTLATSGYNVFQLWKVGSNLYGSYVSA
jgi:hypothetical protein